MKILQKYEHKNYNSILQQFLKNVNINYSKCPLKSLILPDIVLFINVHLSLIRIFYWEASPFIFFIFLVIFSFCFCFEFFLFFFFPFSSFTERQTLPYWCNQHRRHWFLSLIFSFIVVEIDALNFGRTLKKHYCIAKSVTVCKTWSINVFNLEHIAIYELLCSFEALSILFRGVLTSI